MFEFKRDYHKSVQFLRGGKLELEEERGLMIGEYFARNKVYFTTVSSNEKSDLKRGGRWRERERVSGQEEKSKKRKEQEQLCRLREDGAVPTEGCVISLQFYPFPLRSNSAAAVLLILFYQT